MAVKAEEGADPQAPLCTSLSSLLHWKASVTSCGCSAHTDNILRLMMGQNTARVKDNGYSLMNSIGGVTALCSESPVRCSGRLYCYNWNQNHAQFLCPSQNTAVPPDTAHLNTANAPPPICSGRKDILVCMETTRTWLISMGPAIRCTQLCGENFHRGQLLYLGLFFTANFYDFSEGSKPQQIKAL